MFAARRLGCDGDGNAGVESGEACCGECVYGWYTWFSCLASACDVLEISVGDAGVSGRQDWIWALQILEEHGKSGLCVCV